MIFSFVNHLSLQYTSSPPPFSSSSDVCLTGHLPAIVIRVLVVPESTQMLLSALFVDGLDLLGGELESHGTEVVRQSLLLGRGRDGDNVLVDAPPQCNLAGSHAVLFRQRGIDFINRTRCTFGDCSERSIRGCRDTLLLVVGEQLRVLQVRVEFNL